MILKMFQVIKDLHKFEKEAKESRERLDLELRRKKDCLRRRHAEMGITPDDKRRRTTYGEEFIKSECDCSKYYKMNEMKPLKNFICSYLLNTKNDMMNIVTNLFPKDLAKMVESYYWDINEMEIWYVYVQSKDDDGERHGKFIPLDTNNFLAEHRLIGEGTLEHIEIKYDKTIKNEDGVIKSCFIHSNGMEQYEYVRRSDVYNYMTDKYITVENMALGRGNIQISDEHNIGTSYHTLIEFPIPEWLA